MRFDIAHLRHFGRMTRALGLKVLLHVTLLACRVEDWVRPRESKAGKRVLVIVFGGLGDCLLFDPLFRQMKEQWPGVRIDVLSAPFHGMWRGLDSIDQVIYFGYSRFKWFAPYVSLFRRIYRGRYDVAIEGLAMLPRRGTWSIFTSLVLLASQAPLRVGRPLTGRLAFRRGRGHHHSILPQEEMKYLQRRSWSEPGALHPSINRVIDLPHPELRTRHESYYVGKAVGIEVDRRPNEPRMSAESVDTLWARQLIRREKFSEKDVVVGLVTETTYFLKSWPLERFREVVLRGIRDGMKFVLLGRAAAENGALGVPTGDRGGIADLSGATTLEQMVAVIGQCDIFLSADTGPAHIAQACGVPTVVLFGPSNEREFGPMDLATHSMIAPTEPLPCRPCIMGPCVRGESCMNLISVDRVYAELRAKYLAVRAPRGAFPTLHTAVSESR